MLLLSMGWIGIALMLLRAALLLYVSGYLPGAGVLPDQPAALPSTTDLLTTLALLAAFVLITRFGRRMRRDARISDEPGDHSIS
ncbi:hypothetical protein [Hymenobacter guriensis]|uniref:Uncharacterized protein n=1 Tax=Hymenobacter guriensis TaxID=2793065 RepID=A0ABS0L029_9BACT|nr:hypothetical protein [Hymenobacter guriensis]MBG8553464.1 hypothetical protein [Hymenobacter guriensis]